MSTPRQPSTSTSDGPINLGASVVTRAVLGQAVGAFVVFLTGSAAAAAVQGDDVASAIVEAVFGLAFFGWVTVLVLTIVLTPVSLVWFAGTRFIPQSGAGTYLAAAFIWITYLAVLEAFVPGVLPSASAFMFPGLLAAAALGGFAYRAATRRR